MHKAIKMSGYYTLISIYRFFFLKKFLFKFNKLLFKLSLRGLGILNFESDRLSGECAFIKKISKILNNSIVVDVGANIGGYSDNVISLAPNVKIYAFEPHPTTFKKLEIQANEHKYIALNAACSDVEGKLKLYDYQAQGGTSHASLYEEVFSKIHKGISEIWEVDVTTIDEFVKLYKIPKISLLKIDTEGNELKVLQGAKQTIAEKKVDIIHFEFNEMNVVSGVFLKNIYEALNDYFFYRMLPNSLVNLGEYCPIEWEIFAYQNIVAIRKDSIAELKRYLDL